MRFISAQPILGQVKEEIMEPVTLTWIEVLTELKKLLEATPVVDLTQPHTWAGKHFTYSSSLERKVTPDGRRWLYLSAGMSYDHNVSLVSTTEFIVKRPQFLVKTFGKTVKSLFTKDRCRAIFSLDGNDYDGLRHVQIELVLPRFGPNPKKKQPPTVSVNLKLEPRLHAALLDLAKRRGQGIEEVLTHAVEELVSADLET